VQLHIRVVLVALVATLAGCGGGDQSSGTPLEESTSASATASPGDDTAEVKKLLASS
jgi:hypothetical protein